MTVKCPACGAAFGGAAEKLPTFHAEKAWCTRCQTIHPKGAHTRPLKVGEVEKPDPRDFDDEKTPTETP